MIKTPDTVNPITPNPLPLSGGRDPGSFGGDHDEPEHHECLAPEFTGLGFKGSGVIGLGLRVWD